MKIKRLVLTFLFSFLSLFFLTSQAHAAPPAGFQTTQIIGSGMSNTSGFEFAPDGRIFILERTGAVKIYKNGALLSTPFVTLPSISTGDRGLIGIDFDPSFNTNHYVYFYYTKTDQLNYVVRYDASTDVGQNATVIYHTTDISQNLHVGGTIRFGPDGKLYISVGDNGISSNAQSLANVHGKILRINKDGTIPSDNPFYGQSDKSPEIYAYGLRNPFRFQFDSATGRMFVGDVGEDTWEEVNRVSRGQNYGWPLCEGLCSPSNPQLLDPIYTYNHNGGSASVAEGPIYHGSMFPSQYQGTLFFGDYALGFIKTMTLDANGNSTGVSNFDTSAGSVVDMKVASDGSLYYITYFPSVLYRVTYSTGNQIPVAVASADVTQGQDPLTVNFSSNGTYDPDNDPLTYSWNFGDGTSSTQANPSKTYPNKGTYIVQLTVSDPTHQAQATPITIQVGTPPTVHVDSPTDGAIYHAGDTINFSGSGTDAQGNALPDSAFTTEIVFHHQTHTHPFYGPFQQRTGSTVIPTFGESSPDTWYEIKITGTDSNNLSTTAHANIYPQKIWATYNTSTPGLQILLDGQPTDTPLTVQQVVGFRRQLSVVPVQQQNGNYYQFTDWSDTGSINHTVTTPANDFTLTANFPQATAYTGSYYDNNAFSGSPAFTRQDPTIDFTWGDGVSPGPGLQPYGYAVRWIKNQLFAQGRYIFTAFTDDGMRLYIDGQLAINAWIDQSVTRYQTTQWLSGGTHEVKMEFYNGTQEGIARLFVDLDPDQTPPGPTPTPTITPTPGPTNTPTPTPTRTPTPVPPTPTRTPTPTPTRTPTPTPNGPTPTRTPTPTPTRTPTPTPTGAPTPTPTGTIVLNFNNLPGNNSTLVTDGTHPPYQNIISWGTAGTLLTSPSWRKMTTNNLSYTGNNTSTTFSFVDQNGNPAPRKFISFKIFNGAGGSNTVTAKCNSTGPTTQFNVTANQLLTASTGWTGTCNTVTLTSPNGDYTNFDDFSVQ